MNDWDNRDVMKDIKEFKEAMKDNDTYLCRELDVYNEKTSQVVEKYFEEHPDEPVFILEGKLFLRSKDYDELKEYLLNKGD